MCGKRCKMAQKENEQTQTRQTEKKDKIPEEKK
jgi:hypothetical protein